MALGFLHTDRVPDPCHLSFDAKARTDEQGRQNAVLYHQRTADNIPVTVCEFRSCYYDGYHAGNVCDLAHCSADDLSRCSRILGHLGL